MSELVLHIPAISCGHCIHTIKTELGEISGIKSVDGDLEKKEVKVAFEPPATENQIIERLTEINYPPQL